MLCRVILTLLIEPYGIEIEVTFPYIDHHTNLLIEPYGIEIVKSV